MVSDSHKIHIPRRTIPHITHSTGNPGFLNNRLNLSGGHAAFQREQPHCILKESMLGMDITTSFRNPAMTKDAGNTAP